MANKYRLSSNAYDRETPDEQITPKKIYFISVEGVATEVEYLQGLSDYRADLGIDSLVNVEILRRKTKDGYSAPDQVVELGCNIWKLIKEMQSFDNKKIPDHH